MNRIFITSFLSIVILILLLTILPYFLTFNSYSFSLSPNDWGSFGDYISGVLSVINLLIFIFLTFYISNLDKRKSENELSLQRIIVKTQFRQSELNQLEIKLNEVLDNNGYEDKHVILNRITKASLILTDFINQKGFLFPILNSDFVKKHGEDLLGKLSQLFDIIDEIYGLEHNEIMQKNLERNLQDYIFKKNEFVEILQKFILADLN